MPRRFFGLLLVLFGVSSVAVDAQQRGLALFPTLAVEFETSPASLGRVVRAVRLPSHVPSDDAVVVAGGRYVAWSAALGGASHLLVVLDVRTATFVSTGLYFQGGIMGADPSRPRIFVRVDTRHVAVIELPSLSVLLIATAGVLDDSSRAHITRLDGRELLLVPHGTIQPPLSPWPVLNDQVDVIDLTRGIVERTFSIRPAVLGSWALGSGGSRIVVASDGVGPFDRGAGVFSFDVRTGALVARNTSGTPVAEPFVRNVVFGSDDAHGRVLATLAARGAPLVALDANALSPLAALSLSQATGLAAGALGHNQQFRPATVLQPLNRLLIHAMRDAGERYFGARCLESRLAAVDLDSGQAVSVDLASAWRAFTAGQPFCDGQFVVLSVPDRPSLNAHVEASRVTLSWTDPGNTQHFDVEAGSAPGLRDLVATSVSGTSFVAEAVPAGTYYVRVRAINDVGRSLPSVEVPVVVR